MPCRLSLIVVLACSAPVSPHPEVVNWVGTWATAPQPAIPSAVAHDDNQTLRLIVHTSIGGAQVRIRVSNTFGDVPLQIGAAHIAKRVAGASIDPASDRAVSFGGVHATTVPAGATVTSDAVQLDVPARADLAISLYLPASTAATTSHLLALQTSYVAAGDMTAARELRGKTIDTWPFLTGVEVAADPRATTLVMFGDSYIDGDGSTADANHRWGDALAALAHAGVANEGMVGNRLLRDSPASSRVGPALGPSALARFERDVLAQPGVHVVVVRIGGNDIGLPGNLAPADEAVIADDVIAGYTELVKLAHAHGLRIVAATLTPNEGTTEPPSYASPDKDAVREQVNAWIRTSGAFDAVVDADAILRDPSHPSRLLPALDSGDHLHPNDAGYAALAKATVPYVE